MKIWARVRKNNKTTKQDVVEIPQKDASEVEDWHEALCELCSKLNLSRPVILDKHVNELLRFSHTVFRPDDFKMCIRDRHRPNSRFPKKDM